MAVEKEAKRAVPLNDEVIDLINWGLLSLEFIREEFNSSHLFLPQIAIESGAQERLSRLGLETVPMICYCVGFSPADLNLKQPVKIGIQQERDRRSSSFELKPSWGDRPVPDKKKLTIDLRGLDSSLGRAVLGPLYSYGCVYMEGGGSINTGRGEGKLLNERYFLGTDPYQREGWVSLLLVVISEDETRFGRLVLPKDYRRIFNNDGLVFSREDFIPATGSVVPLSEDRQVVYLQRAIPEPVRAAPQRSQSAVRQSGGQTRRQDRVGDPYTPKTGKARGKAMKKTKSRRNL